MAWREALVCGGLVGLARGGGGTGAAFTPWVAFSEREAMARVRLASLQAGLFLFEERASGTLNGHTEHCRVFFADTLGGRAAAVAVVASGSGPAAQIDHALDRGKHCPGCGQSRCCRLPA